MSLNYYWNYYSCCCWYCCLNWLKKKSRSEVKLTILLMYENERGVNHYLMRNHDDVDDDDGVDGDDVKLTIFWLIFFVPRNDVVCGVVGYRDALL